MLPLYRCLTCGREGLARTEDRIYCPQCGQIYPLKRGIVDFLSDLGHLTPVQAIAHSPLFAWGYERLWRPRALSLLSGEDFGPEREAQMLVDLLGDADPILDLGCAAGYWSRMVLERSPQATLIGLDSSMVLLQEAVQQAQPEWIHHDLVRAEARQLPLASSSFGAVISGGSLNELPLQETLQGVARVLRPGGIFISMHSQRVEGWGQTAQQLLRVAGLEFWGEAELKAELAAAGLETKRYLSFGTLTFLVAARREL